ncbi:hypothetical protein PSQ20_21145 [Curvibacter sp. RS43]|uniref:hypothetical protein n=1 Tax=Curvibacter microcysteis TaxID=3026419 RepID=UPI0023610F69|nr:hypothetical protein [Curvibacter sp. RS43]MDD0812862.1 hypothetical protein [Curvibacter sp. RS43]
MILNIEKSTLEPFGEPELVRLIEVKGEAGLLPKALTDAQLLQLADQFREIQAGRKGPMLRVRDTVALPLVLTLVAESGIDLEAMCSDASAIKDAMSVFSVVVDREIVNRLLQCTDDVADSGVSEMFQELFGSRYPKAQAATLNRFNRRQAQKNRPARSARGSAMLRSHR